MGQVWDNYQNPCDHIVFLKITTNEQGNADLNIQETAGAVISGDRRALARAITLVESARGDHRGDAQGLINAILPNTGRALRLGLSGAPGVGKSTFIEAFGTHLTGLGKKVGVLAIDPTSARTGGSILGDKTRMEELARDPLAFVRPSPSGGTLGGVARRTREAALLMDAAGFDVVMVETVGVGQSETMVADMTDMFVLLLGPGGGDDLQGIKRGIMELADMIVVTKSDGDLEAAAKRAEADLIHALHLMRPKTSHWTVPVVRTSAMSGEGIDRVWAGIEDFRGKMTAAGALDALRADQAKAWLWTEIRTGLLEQFQADPAIAGPLAEAEQQVSAQKAAPAAVAATLLAKFRRSGT